MDTCCNYAKYHEHFLAKVNLIPLISAMYMYECVCVFAYVCLLL